MSNALDFSTPKKEVVEYYENFCKKFELYKASMYGEVLRIKSGSWMK